MMLIFLEGASLEVVENFTCEAFNQMLVILKKMSKVELETSVQFSDNFKLFGDPK